jgi:hypothetical protein
VLKFKRKFRRLKVNTVVPKADTNGCAAKSRLVMRVYAMPFSQMSQLTHCTTSSVDYLIGDPARCLHKLLTDLVARIQNIAFCQMKGITPDPPPPSKLLYFVRGGGAIRGVCGVLSTPLCRTVAFTWSRHAGCFDISFAEVTNQLSVPIFTDIWRQPVLELILIVCRYFWAVGYLNRSLLYQLFCSPGR